MAVFPAWEGVWLPAYKPVRQRYVGGALYWSHQRPHTDWSGSVDDTDENVDEKHRWVLEQKVPASIRTHRYPNKAFLPEISGLHTIPGPSHKSGATIITSLQSGALRELHQPCLSVQQSLRLICSAALEIMPLVEPLLFQLHVYQPHRRGVLARVSSRFRVTLRLDMGSLNQSLGTKIQIQMQGLV